MSRQTPTQAALAAVEQAQTTVARWAADQAAKQAELDDLERRAGADVLADESAAERVTGQMVRLRAGIDIASRAAAAASEQLTEARRGVLLAAAGDRRDTAAGIRADVERRQAITARLLAELAEHENCHYLPASLPSDEVSRRVQMGETVTVARPRTAILADQAGDLEREAARLDSDAAAPAETLSAALARLDAPAGPVHDMAWAQQAKAGVGRVGGPNVLALWVHRD